MDTVHETLRETADVVEAVGDDLSDASDETSDTDRQSSLGRLDDVSTEEMFDEMVMRDTYTENCWKIAQILREKALIVETFEERDE